MSVSESLELSQRAVLRAGLTDWLAGVANEFEASKQKMVNNMAEVSTGLQQTLSEISSTAKSEVASELANFHEHLEKEMELQFGSLRGDVESIAKVKRDELMEIVEKLHTSTVDELQILKKNALAELSQHLSEKIESTKSSVATSTENAGRLAESKVAVIVQQGEVVVNEAIEGLEKDLKGRIRHVSDDLDRRIQTTRQKLETTADIELRTKWSKDVEVAKRDLSKSLDMKIAEFSEQAKSIVQDLSSTLRDNAGRRATESHEELEDVAKGTAKELQERLAKIGEELTLSHLTNARAVVKELKRLNEKQGQIQGILSEASSRVEQLKAMVSARSAYVTRLEEQFKDHMATAEQTFRDIDDFVARVEKTMGDLEQRAETTFQHAKTMIEQQVPEETRWAIAKGRSQVILQSKAETAREIHLSLRSLYAELQIVEKEIREKIENIKRTAEDQKEAIVATAQYSGNESLSQWVKSKLSSL
ncbi:MAG: hypothetical protein V1857_00380 [archaeon]